MYFDDPMLPSIKSTYYKDVKVNFHHDDETTTPEPLSSSSITYGPSSSNDYFSSPPQHSFMENSDLFDNLSVQNSRYNNDFIEIDLLGKGGFASAFRARNRLDGIYYAIKKIRLGNNIDEAHPYEKILREIKNLARLEHQNVIRYYSSWLEFIEDSQQQETDDSDWEESISNISYSEKSGMSHIQFGETSTSDENKKRGGWILFIQMQLCSTTLHDYIKHRNKQYSQDMSHDIVDIRRNSEIFAKIVEGTAYIHDQGLIHRDLKPSNIFLSMPAYNVSDMDGKRRQRSRSVAPIMDTAKMPSDISPSDSEEFEMWEASWVPKIGDFGLAAKVHEEEVPSGFFHSKKRPQPRRTRTIGVGTRTYASPEQLAIPAQAYDEKVDIYSLGIILFELFQPFVTGMERADSLEKLKHGVFPPGFPERYPKVTALITWMMDKDPQKRPSAHQLRETPLDKEETVLDQKTKDIEDTLLDRKNKEIEELKARLEQKDREIQALQLKMEAMQLDLKKKKVKWNVE